MDERQRNNFDDIEVNIGEMLGVLWKSAGFIILSGLLFAMLAFSVTKFLINPEYQSVTKMYVLSKQSGDTLTQSDMQTSTYLTKDYAELIKSRAVAEAVIAELGLGMKSSELLAKIAVETPMDTRIVNIVVTDEDPYEAAKIANTTRDVASNHIQEVMEIEAVNVAEEANIPEEPASPNVMKNTLLGGFFGVFLVMAIVIIMYLLNDAIQTSEDVEKYLDASVLGVIPLKGGKMAAKKKKKGLFRNKLERGV